MFLAESRLLDQTITKQYNQMQITLKLMNNHLYSLEKDVKFLSSLDVMDEILADDIDKKLSRLLEQKANTIGKDATLLLVNNHNKIIASSNAAQLLKNFSLPKNLSQYGYFIREKKLYFYSQVFASFDKSHALGFLILEYNLKNLNIFLTQQNNIHSYILDRAHKTIIGQGLRLELDFDTATYSKITDKYIIVYKKIDFFKGEKYLIYAVNKATALKTLYDFIKFILSMSLFIILVVLYIAYRYSKKIIQPIEELTNVTNEITHTQNYTQELVCSSNDEIQTLTQAFNTMLKTTSSALAELEEENKRRVTQFIDLINLFNKIIQTPNEKECISSSTEEIKHLTNNEKLYFQNHKATSQAKMSIDLYVTNFQNNQKAYYGTIVFGFENYFDENEKKFYASVAAMITLQLEKIRLIENTLSVSKAKSAFISNMSHELRTPLNAIISATQIMITYEELTEEQQDSIATIESSAHYLLELINGILDITKIEAGKMEVCKEEFNLIELVTNASEILMPLIQDKGLYFEIHTEFLTQENCYTDPKILQQIVINLLSNAIKFTDSGEITVKLSNDAERLFIEIKDSGIEIEKENIKLLFNDFTQVENIMQKKHKGTGIGLSLSKKMAQLLGGDITIESEGLNQGAAFTLWVKI